MSVAKNWGSRPHSPPGPDHVVKQHKGMASGIQVEPPERRTKVDLTRGGPGSVHTPGWFRTPAK